MSALSGFRMSLIVGDMQNNPKASMATEAYLNTLDEGSVMVIFGFSELSCLSFWEIYKVVNSKF